MQRSQWPPKFVTSRDQHTDPETGSVYEPEQPIPYEVAVRLGLMPSTERSARPGLNTGLQPGLNRMAPKGDNR